MTASVSARLARIPFLALVLSISLYAWRMSRRRDNAMRDAADELETLRAFAELRPVNLPTPRVYEARRRLDDLGQITWLDESGVRYLTLTGWARIERPLSDEDIEFLHRITESRICAWPSALSDRMRAMGLMMWDRADTTPAGRALLKAEREDRS